MTPTPQTTPPVYFISYHFANVAGHSGYDKIVPFLGEPIEISRVMRMLGETVLRVPGKLISWYGGSFEYSRHDFVKEVAAFQHMLRHRNCIYHFTQAEKSYKLLAGMSGKRGHRFVGTFHHPPSHFPWLFRSTRHLARLSHAIILSNVQRDCIEGIVGQGKVTFVPHGVDTEYFTPRSGGRGDHPLRCVFAGNHMRDFDTLPAVVSGILERVPGAEFFIVSRNRKCEQFAGRERVRWLRDIPDDEYLAALQNSDLAVLPLVESVAVNSALEAMACGLPVVTNRGGVADYLTDACSVMVPAGDAAAMVEAASHILKNADLLRRMGNAARSRALEFSWPRVAEMTRDVYRKVAEAHD